MKHCLLQCFNLWRDRTAVSVEASQREDEAVQGAVQLLSSGDHHVLLAMHTV